MCVCVELQKADEMKSEMSQDESGSESEDLQHSDGEEVEDHTLEDDDDDMVRIMKYTFIVFPNWCKDRPMAVKIKTMIS